MVTEVRGGWQAVAHNKRVHAKTGDHHHPMQQKQRGCTAAKKKEKTEREMVFVPKADGHYCEAVVGVKSQGERGGVRVLSLHGEEKKEGQELCIKRRV